MALTREQLARLRKTKPQGRNRVRQAMALVGVTQEELAEAVGKKQPEISKVCRGAYGSAGLPVESVRPIAEFFGCLIEDLFPPNSEVA